MNKQIWQPFSTAPRDRPVFLWDDRQGPVLMEYRHAPFNEMWRTGWYHASLVKGVLVAHGSVYPDKWTYWCEVDDLRP